MAKLSDYVSIKASSKKLVGDDFWLLNLDMVEQQTGRVIEYNRVSADKLDGSIIQFDTDCVLYSKLRPNLNKVVLPEIDGYATSEMLPLRPDTSVLSREYLAEYLRSDHFVTWAISKTAGAKMPRLGSKELLSKELHIPSLEEQAHIVALFQRVAELIDTKKQELELLDELVKSRFIELFGDPVDNPMGWAIRQLQELVTDDCTISYGIVQTGDEQEEGVPVFRPVDIVNRIPVRSELKKTTEEISNKYKRTILKGREMLITVRANIADTCIVGEEFAGCNVGRGIVPIRTKENEMVLEFLKYQIDSKHLNDNIKALAKGITLVQLNMEDLREVNLIVPPIEQQKSFVEFAKQTDKSKLAVQNSIAELEELKKSLMQKYFG